MSQEPECINIRVWTDEDYPSFCQWWKARNHWIVPKELLHQLGYVLERNGSAEAAIFVYPTAGLGVAHAKFIVGRPGKTLKQSRDDFEILFNGVKHCLAALDYHMVFVDCSKVVGRELVRHGFVECSQDQSFYMVQF